MGNRGARRAGRTDHEPLGPERSRAIIDAWKLLDSAGATITDSVTSSAKPATSGWPRRTAYRDRLHAIGHDWPASDVVTLDVHAMPEEELRREIVRLRTRNAKLIALLRLVMVLMKVCDLTLARRRVPDGASKERLISAIERSRRELPLRILLRVLGLSSGLHHAWKRESACELDDVSSCPPSRPHQLATEELETIGEMVRAKEYRHVPTGETARRRT